MKSKPVAETAKPKNKREVNKKYIVLSDGADFRTVSKKMTEAGWVMNHATARNYLMVAMKNFVTELSKELKMPMSEETVQQIISNNDLHDNLVDILDKIAKEDIDNWK